MRVVRVDVDELKELQSRLEAPVGQSSELVRPPLRVPSLLAVLVPPAAILGVVAIYRGGPPTEWTAYAATRAALAHVMVEFDEFKYTADTERDVEEYRGRYATPTLRSAWVRPLSRVTELVITRSDAFADTGRLNVAASVRFTDVADLVELPDQHDMFDDGQWARADELLRVIRDGIDAPR